MTAFSVCALLLAMLFAGTARVRGTPQCRGARIDLADVGSTDVPG